MKVSDGKVVSLEGRVAATERSRAQQLVAECRAVTMRYLPELLTRMLDSADDTLFELADKAESNTAQNAYFDAMRELRLRRRQLERDFSARLEEGFERFPEGAARALEADEPAAFDADADSLSLVEEEDLEESLAVTTMVSKVRTRCARELHAIEHRFALLAQGHNIDGDALPLAPKAICQAFRDAMQCFDAETAIKLIVYKLFDNCVVSNLAPLYEECNALLAEAGILPKLRMSVKRQPGGAAPRRPVAPVAGEAAPEETPTERFLEASQGGFQPLVSATALGTLRQLLGEADEVVAPEQEEGAIHNVDLLNALTAIQRRDVRFEPNGEGAMIQIKETLAREIQSVREEGRLGLLGKVDNDIIDIVGLMFDYVLDDENLPAAAKAALARLQIPMLKVAIADRALFRHKHHPARRLLDAMARAALGIDEELASADCPVLQKIDYIVGRVLDDFEDDLTLFERLLEEFERFMKMLDEQEQRQQRESRKRMEQRERQRLAATWVMETIAAHIRDKTVPRAIYELITGPWHEVMTRTYLDHGEEAPEWKERLRFIDLLIWSVEPKRAGTDRRKLATILKELVTTLRAGLEEIGLPPSQRDELLETLEQSHLAAMHGQRPEEEAAVRVRVEKPEGSDEEEASPEQIEEALDAMRAQLDQMSELEELLQEPIVETGPGAPLEADRLEGFGEEEEVEEITLATTGPEAKREPEIDDEHWRTVQALQVGQWIKIRGDDGRSQRAKLVWRSDLLAECTFINWKFQVVADLGFNELAAKFRSGDARLIEDLPLFEKAMDAVMSRLHKARAQHSAPA